MSYTSIPSGIIEDENEILTINNYANNQYQLLSHNSFSYDKDYDDESSIVSRSVRSAASCNVLNLRNNPVHTNQTNCEIQPSGTDFGNVSVNSSENVVFGTVYEGPVAIDVLVLGRNDLKQNCNFQFSNNSNPLETKKLLQADNVEYVNDSTATTKYDSYEFIERQKYDALTPKEVSKPLVLPVKRVIISHTETPICKNYAECTARVCQIQNYHMNNNRYSDIAYNFLVGGDGRAYEGGYAAVGAHTKNNNEDSIGIAFIGNFVSYEAQEKQINAAFRVINDGININKIHADYVLYGHRQLQSTSSPGTMLYNQIILWPHWSKDVMPLQRNGNHNSTIPESSTN